MPQTLQIAVNPVFAQIFGANRETKLKISELLSYEVEAASFKTSNWDGRSSFFDFTTGIFPAGFTQMLSRELKADGHTLQFKTIPLPQPLGPEIGTFDPLGFGFSERYDYQSDTVKKLLKYGRMVARVATGGGKTNIAILAACTINRPTLFLTTRTSLMWQMKRAFEKAGMTPGVIGDGIWQPRKGITVAMVQTLAARLKPIEKDWTEEKIEEQLQIQKITHGYLRFVEFLIGEEAHEVGGFEYWAITHACRNAHYRLALTATPFMRPDGEANMRLQGAFGSIGIEISEQLLIDRGILATPYFKYLQVPANPMCRRNTKWPTCYDLNIINNKSRLELAVKEIVKAKSYGLTCMVLVKRKNHGELLKQALEACNVRVEFLHGVHEEVERKDAINRLANKEIDCLMGTSIFDVGIDVPSIGMIVLLGGMKGEVELRQRVGRGLREKKTGANIAFIVDFMDEGNKITFEHALQRKAIIQATPGFSERILKPSEDFPYHLLSGN